MRGSRLFLTAALSLAGLFFMAPPRTASADMARPPVVRITPPEKKVPTSAIPALISLPSAIATRSIAPFGGALQTAPAGALWRKWNTVQAEIADMQPTLDRCLRDFRRCNAGARHFRAIIKQALKAEGRDRLAIVNRSINTAIAYKADMEQWQQNDAWSAPLGRNGAGLFDTGTGDCEDYAIAKYVALRIAGTAFTDLKILILEDMNAGIHHAALAARVDDRWLILDNRWSRLLDDSEATFFKPLYALDADGVERFIMPDAQIVRLRTRKPPAPV